MVELNNGVRSGEAEEQRCPLWARLGCARAVARLCRRRGRARVAPEHTANGRPPRSRESRRRINHPPSAQYSALGERVRTSTPAALQCALFCGGSRCKYEQNYQRATAIQGLYSDWITEDILAMARPSTASIAARNIIQQFHSWGIRSVVNLQTPGEHASCGPPLTRSGFTYDPAVFMANDIYYYNFAWPDYGEASLSGLMDMAKVLAFALQQGKVAVHCHAGLGRTGVLIACYLVYSLRVRANDAIRLVRKRRPRSVQTSGQILCVQQFEHYLLPQTVVFSSKEPLMLTKDKKTAEFTLRQYLHRQRATLHGLDERSFRELPKIVYCLCERLLRLCACQQSPGLDFRVRTRPFYKSFLAYRLRRTRPPDPATPVEETTNHVCALPMVEWRDPVEEDIERHLETVSRITGGSTGGGAGIPALHVYEAFVVDHHSLPEDKQRYLKQLRTDINQRAEAFAKIDDEEDPAVLSGLLFEWLEGLKAPVLGREQLALIVGRGHDVEATVLALDHENIMLVEYLLRVVTRLRPLAAGKKVEMLRRLLAALTHQTVNIHGKCLPTRRDFARLRDGTCNQVINFFLRMIVELQKDMVKPGIDDNDVVVMPRRCRIKAWK
ncbi:protein tyrosine phosphatase domain-containing protein 1-like isoform X2 [Pectinophora gossypiella]|uniref:protein tyrosine phosphatase domain-containing protein 1-like isoform X2 n=1 Tax=Pectinophora gossypiella TaxID=13191 RepID=UPI00214EE4DE|nr:protein tyrosine phosphatase domain-containing protein 1-like isoform X2 [Pectinophora gossypiella]